MRMDQDASGDISLGRRLLKTPLASTKKLLKTHVKALDIRLAAYQKMTGWFVKVRNVAFRSSFYFDKTYQDDVPSGNRSSANDYHSCGMSLQKSPRDGWLSCARITLCGICMLLNLFVLIVLSA